MGSPPSRQASAQANFGIDATYAMRPPRHRFIYATEPLPWRPAANGIFQRGNDGLGATGGRRILQGKTMQATNRIGRAVR